MARMGLRRVNIYSYPDLRIGKAARGGHLYTAGEHRWPPGSTWNWTLIEVRDSGRCLIAITNPIYRQ